MADTRTQVPTNSLGDQAPHEVRSSIALAVLGVFVTYIPITGVSVALTTIGRQTGASTSDLQWVSDAYVIPMAASVLSAGVFGDVHGRRRLFIVGMATTALGALVAALSALLSGHDALPMLWAGQAVTGIGAGILLPTTLSLISHAVPNPKLRGRWIGWWATGLMLGLALGPIMSGLILRGAGWGWTFVPTVVLALVAGVVALVALPESKAPSYRTLDWAGQANATVAIAASIFATIEGGSRGWGDNLSVGGYVIAAIALVLFLIVEARTASPLMDLKLFRSPTFTAAGFAAAVTLFSVVGTTFLLSLFLGYVQGHSPLRIGAQLIFVSGVGAIANPFVGAVLHRTNALLTLTGGLLLACISVLLLTQIDASTGFVDLAWRLAIFGLSLAVMMTAVSTVAVNSVGWHQAGMAAATNTALRQYGGALGPAVLGVVFSARQASTGSHVTGLHSALLVDAVVLGVAALVCLVTAGRAPRIRD